MYIDEAFDEAFGDEVPVEMNNKLLFSAIKGMIRSTTLFRRDICT